MNHDPFEGPDTPEPELIPVEPEPWKPTKEQVIYGYDPEEEENDDSETNNWFRFGNC